MPWLWLSPQLWEKPFWLVLSSRAWRRIQIFPPGSRKTEFFLVLLEFLFSFAWIKDTSFKKEVLGDPDWWREVACLIFLVSSAGLCTSACAIKCVCNLMFCFVCSPFQISLEFRNLAEKYQTVIADICQKMGCGMAEFVDKHVTSKQDWDKVSVSVSWVYIC